MSGIEIGGLVIGAFPLAISAMEHFEQSKKAAGTFYRFRRVHRKTLGKVKDCQLKFRLNIKALLLPLLVDDTVTKIEYEQLLANPGDAGWREEHVEEALAERLGECYERYTELLKEMEEVMLTLCKATRDDDEDFQALLNSRDTSTNTPAERGKSKLMLRAFTTTQAKKLAYAFKIPQRESILEEVEALTSKLESVLTIVFLPSLVKLAVHEIRLEAPNICYNSDADCMYKLLSEAWFCHCKGLHKTKLWLKPRAATNFELQMMMRFCHGAQICVQMELTDSPLEGGGQNPRSSLRLPLRSTGLQPASPSLSVRRYNNTGIIAGSPSGATTVTQTTSKVCWASTYPKQQQQQQQQPQKQALADIRHEGLCETVKTLGSSTTSTDPIGFLTDDDTHSYYALLHSNLQSSSITTAGQTALSEVLCGNVPVSPTRLQRYTIAATLASSFVRFESTPWIREWTSNDVHFPDGDLSGQAAKLKYEEPFTLAQFDTVASPPGDNYKSFGILLLELCFGKPLEEYTVQQRPMFAAAIADPMVRHFVACQWLEDVEGEAGEHFANALRHCLQQSPANLQNNKWREQFAQSVVWPLQQCVEIMQPSKTTL